MRRYNWHLFLLIILAMLAFTACSGTEAAFEPTLVEDEVTDQLAALTQEAAEDGELSLAELVANLDARLNSADYVASDGCAYSIGYWKNHPGSWESDILVLGDTEYTAVELQSILNTPPRGDASYILAQQLIAAKLNGADDGDLAEAIAAADEWLAANPLDSAPTAETRHEGILLAELLDDYNNGLLGNEACDERDVDEFVDDDDDEVDDDDDKDFEDDDEREVREDGDCTGADPHPHATTLAEDYDVTYEEIMEKFCDGYGFGEIEIAYLLADEVGMDVEEIHALREAGMGWGNIRKEVGASPGLGKDKPKKNDDGSLPPGLEKKDDDRTPPGQEKRDDRQTPPGQAKKDK